MALALTFPAGLAIVFCWLFTSVAPFADCWHWIHIDQSYRLSEISLLKVLFITHNAHPYGLPTLIFLLVADVIAYRFDILAIASTIIIIANATIFMALARMAGIRSFVCVLAIAGLACSLRQDEIFLFGFDFGLALLITFSLLAFLATIFFLETESATQKLGWGTAVILAAGAAGLCDAAAAGLFPALLLLLVTSRWRPANLLLAITICVLCAAWLAYFFNLAMIRPPVSQIRPPFSEAPLGFVILSGASLFENRYAAFGSGLVILGAFGWLGLQNWRGNARARALVSIGIFALGMIATLAMARGLMGGINPGRYAILSMPLALSVLMMAALFIDKGVGRRRYIVGFAAGALIAVAYPVSIAVAFKNGIENRRTDIEHADLLLDYRLESDQALAEISRWPAQTTRNDANFLERNNYNVFTLEQAYPPERRKIRRELMTVLYANQPGPGTRMVHEGLMAHAPKQLKVPSEGYAKLEIAFGVMHDAWQGLGQSTGVCFQVVADSAATPLWQRCLDPKSKSTDRGTQAAIVMVPPATKELSLETACRVTCAWAWSYWGRISLR